MTNTNTPAPGILTINTGSSSVTSALYRLDPDITHELTMTAERIGSELGTQSIRDTAGATLYESDVALSEHQSRRSRRYSNGWARPGVTTAMPQRASWCSAWRSTESR